MNIPLSEIPNAAVAPAPSLEQARGDGDTTYRQIRTSIDEGGAALHQNIGTAGAAGAYIAKAGTDLSQLGGELGKGVSQVDSIVKAGASATYQNNSYKAMSAFYEGLDKTKPETWTSQYQDFLKNNQNAFTQGLSPIQKAVIAPDLVRNEAATMASLGVKAHTQFLQNTKEAGTTAMTDAINGGRYQDAATQLDQMNHAGIMTAEENNHWQNTITGSHQQQSLENFIRANPQFAQQQIEKAINANSQMSIPGDNGVQQLLSKITPGELQNYKNKAIQVGDYQNGQSYNSFSNTIDSDKQRPPSLQALQSDPTFKRLDSDQQQKLTDQYLNKAIMTDSATVGHYNDTRAAVLAFNPDPNDKSSRPFQQENQLRQDISETPKAQRKELNAILEGTMKDWVSSSGTLSKEVSIPNMMKGELTLFYNTNETDKFQAKQKTDDAIFAFDKAWKDPKQKGGGTLEDARQILNRITNPDNRGIGADKILQSQPSGIWNWLKGTKPQASNDDGSAMGKVTSYGYQGDSTSDKNSQAGIGSQNNKLDHTSLAVSPDIEAKMKAQGIKQGDQVALKLSDGSTVTKTLSDRTMQDAQAVKKFGKPLRGRFDFYSPDGVHPQDGIAVQGFSKVGQS